MEKEEKKTKETIIYINEETDKKIEEMVKELYEKYKKVDNKQFLINEIIALEEDQCDNSHDSVFRQKEKIYARRDIPTLIGNLIAQRFGKYDIKGAIHFPAFEKGYAVADKLEQEYLKELEKNGEIGFKPDE